MHQTCSGAEIWTHSSKARQVCAYAYAYACAGALALSLVPPVGSCDGGLDRQPTCARLKHEERLERFGAMRLGGDGGCHGPQIESREWTLWAAGQEQERPSIRLQDVRTLNSDSSNLLLPISEAGIRDRGRCNSQGWASNLKSSKARKLQARTRHPSDHAFLVRFLFLSILRPVCFSSFPPQQCSAVLRR